MDTIRETTAKQTVRNLVTERVRILANQSPVTFLTLCDGDITHEKDVVKIKNALVVSCNTDAKIVDKINGRLWREGIENAMAIPTDICDYANAGNIAKSVVVWFDFCDLAKSWDKFFQAVSVMNLAPKQEIAVTFSAIPRGNMTGDSKFIHKINPRLKEWMENSDDPAFELANGVFRACKKRMRKMGWRCHNAVTYKCMGGRMVTIFFHKSKCNGIHKLRDLEEQKGVDKTPQLVKLNQIAKEMGLTASDLCHAFRSPQAIAHLTMAAPISN